ELLSRHGYTVTTAANGELALGLLHTQSFDVILCDLVMPEIDGPTFYREVQRHYPALAPRVMFLTGDTVGATSMAFLRDCGQPWLYKPCASAEVLRTLEALLHIAHG